MRGRENGGHSLLTTSRAKLCLCKYFENILQRKPLEGVFHFSSVNYSLSLCILPWYFLMKHSASPSNHAARSSAMPNPNVLVEKNQCLQQQLLETSKHLLSQQTYLQESIKTKKQKIANLETQLEKEKQGRRKLREDNKRLLSMHELLEEEVRTWKERYRSMEQKLKGEKERNETSKAQQVHHQPESNQTHTFTHSNAGSEVQPNTNTAFHSVNDFFSDSTIRHILSSDYPEQERLSEFLYQDRTQPFMRPVIKNRSVQCELVGSAESCGKKKPTAVSRQQEEFSFAKKSKHSTFIIREERTPLSRSKSSAPTLLRGESSSQRGRDARGIQARSVSSRK